MGNANKPLAAPDVHHATPPPSIDSDGGSVVAPPHLTSPTTLAHDPPSPGDGGPRCGGSRRLSRTPSFGRLSVTPSLAPSPPKRLHSRSSSFTLQLCANCLRVAACTVTTRTAQPFCGKDCYWSYHVRLGLDEEAGENMVLVTPGMELTPEAASAAANAARAPHRPTRVERSRSTLGRTESNDSPRSRSTNGGLAHSTVAGQSSVESSVSRMVHSNATPDAFSSPRSHGQQTCETCVEE